MIDNKSDPVDAILGAARRCYLEQGFPRTGMKEVAAAAGVEAPVTELYLAALPGQHPGRFPLGGATRLELRNDHLQYAMTWFSLAAILFVITAIFVFRRPAASRGG